MAEHIPYANLSEDQKKLVDSWKRWERFSAAQKGWGLDKLVGDGSWEVREEVAEQGYGLDRLVDDEKLWVRRVVAAHGYGLDRLLYDESPLVRDTARKALEGSV